MARPQSSNALRYNDQPSCFRTLFDISNKDNAVFCEVVSVLRVHQKMEEQAEKKSQSIRFKKARKRMQCKESQHHPQPNTFPGTALPHAAIVEIRQTFV